MPLYLELIKFNTRHGKKGKKLCDLLYQNFYFNYFTLLYKNKNSDSNRLLCQLINIYISLQYKFVSNLKYRINIAIVIGKLFIVVLS